MTDYAEHVKAMEAYGSPIELIRKIREIFPELDIYSAIYVGGMAARLALLMRCEDSATS